MIIKNLLLTFFVLCTISMSAQEIPDPTFNNPFTLFGIGDVIRPGYSTQIAEGGTGIAYHHSHIANPMNPASLGALRFTSFQVGLNVESSVVQSADGQNQSTTGDLQYLSLAFPLQNTLNAVLDGKENKFRNAMMFAITPYSRIGYNVESNTEVQGLGEVINRFKGSGGYYKIQWGNGIEFKENFRAGLNINYIFGRSNALVETVPSEIVGASLITDADLFRGRGFELQYGGQYDLVLDKKAEKPKKTLTIGVSGSLPTSISGENTRVITRTNIFRLLDTVSLQEDVNRSQELPYRTAVGLSYRSGEKFTASADLEINTIRETNNSELRLSSSVSWTPDPKAFGKYWKQVIYRFGAYSQTRSQDLIDSDQGVSFGVGFPIVKPREEVSFVNLSLNLGQLNTSTDITQRYVRFTAGFTLTDNSWFYKRRFK